MDSIKAEHIENKQESSRGISLAVISAHASTDDFTAFHFAQILIFA